MYKIRYSIGLKILAVFLFTVSLAFTALSATGIIYMVSENVYLDGGRSLQKNLWEVILNREAARAADHVYSHYKAALRSDPSGEDAKEMLQTFQKTYAADETNMLFSIEAKGETIFSNGIGRGTYAATTFDDWFYESNTTEDYRDFDTEREMNAFYDENVGSWNDWHTEIIYEEEDGYYSDDPIYRLHYTVYDETRESIQVSAWVDDIQVMDIFYWVNSLSDSVSGMRWGLIVLGTLSLAVCIASLVFLFCGAGRKSTAEGVVLSGLNRIPFDLYFAAVIFCWAMLGISIGESTYTFSTVESILIIGFLSIGIALLALALLLSMAARIKAGTLVKNTMLYRIYTFTAKFWKKLTRRIVYICRGLPLVWKVGVLYAFISLVEFIFVCSTAAGYLILAWCVEKLIFTPLLALVLINMKNLKKGAEEIADGNLQYQVKLQDLVGDFRRHGETLNRIGDGMQVALEQKMQSERLKTELITNVSHDIKTPLTSIINYVDLLKKEGMDSPNAAQYLDVLERQSARLKKLTEDLVEASKASSGAINVVKAPTNVQVLLEQTVGEFEERLSQKEIQVVLSPCEEQCVILADGRLLWRVFDNLMSNICKYALAGTRVYLSMENTGSAIRITFKNISAYPLNISGEELMERFVRGDRSRNTEGSGLGLSIARSLTELQGGVLEIQIDGDLFKSVITIPALTQE